MTQVTYCFSLFAVVVVFVLAFSLYLKIMAPSQATTTFVYQHRKSSTKPVSGENRTHLFHRPLSIVSNCITGLKVRDKESYRSQEFNPGSKKAGEDATKRQLAFMDIYKKNVWYKHVSSNIEIYRSVGSSGKGSTLVWAQETIAALHSVISHLRLVLKKDKIRLLDIPCGDMVWMARFLQTRDDIEYTGMDIVPKLIEKHQITYSNFDWKFIHFDIVKESLTNAYDLVLCRMMLQHLRTDDVMEVLNHISKSGSKYILATTFSGQPHNTELPNTADRFRSLNLELPPYSLVPPICTVRDGDINLGKHHYLSLWGLPIKQVVNCKTTIHHPHGRGFRKFFYSCA